VETGFPSGTATGEQMRFQEVEALFLSDKIPRSKTGRFAETMTWPVVGRFAWSPSRRVRRVALADRNQEFRPVSASCPPLRNCRYHRRLRAAFGQAVGTRGFSFTIAPLLDRDVNKHGEAAQMTLDA